MDEPRLTSLAPFLLFGTGRLVERELALRLADLGLTVRTLGVLGHLIASPALSYSDLARRSDITVQSMHATVRRLIADGLVDGVGTAGQSAQLSITARGRKALDEAQAELADYETELADAAGIHVDDLREWARTALAAVWQVDSTTPKLPQP